MAPTVDETLRSQADYLDALAAAIRTVNRRLDNLTRTDLEARLGVGGAISDNLGGVPRSLFGQSGPSASLGNTEPVIGMTNLLVNPGLHALSVFATTSGATVAAGTGWSIRYVLNSGTEMDNRPFVEDLYERGAADNPFNSQVIQLSTNNPASAAARDIDIFLDSAARALSFPTLPFLVASVRVWSDSNIAAHWTTAEVSVQIYDVAGAIVVAESTPVPLRSFGSGSIRAITAAVQKTQAQFNASTWRLRIRLHLVSDGSAATGLTGSIQFGEAQLHLAYSPDPVPFAPLLGSWVPNLLDNPATLRDTTQTGTRSATPSNTQTLAAGTAILANAEFLKIQSTGNVTLTATPTIANGIDGQMLTILNVDSADTITLQDQGTLALSNLRLTAATVALGPRQSIQLMYSLLIGDWVQVGPLVAVL